MSKIDIDDNYIKTLLTELDNKLSLVQMIIMVISTVILSSVIGLYYYVTDFTNIITAIIITILSIIYVYLEEKRNILNTIWDVKELKLLINKKEEKIFPEYKVKISGYKGTTKIPYEEYKDINNESIGYAVVSKTKNRLLLWFDKNKYNYNKKC